MKTKKMIVSLRRLNYTILGGGLYFSTLPLIARFFSNTKDIAMYESAIWAGLGMIVLGSAIEIICKIQQNLYEEINKLKKEKN